MPRSAVVDIGALVKLPQEFGFTMFVGHPTHSRSGFAAPFFRDVAPAGCDPEQPTFVLGMADLKNALGAIMGDPQECERTADTDGNTIQLTTTGEAAYVRRTQKLMFTEGARHWVLTADGLTLTVDQDGHRPVPDH